MLLFDLFWQEWYQDSECDCDSLLLKSYQGKDSLLVLRLSKLIKKTIRRLKQAFLCQIK